MRQFFNSSRGSLWITISTFAFLIAASSTVAQQSHWIYGEWCSDNEIMYADNTGVGFNEHTSCGWTAAPGDISPTLLTLACRNIYYDGEIAVEAHHEMLKLKVTRMSAAELSIRFGDDDAAVSFTKCTE